MTKPVINYFLTWDKAVQVGVQKAGGKGWNLGRMAKYGFKIPNGGVLTTQAHDQFIKYNNLQDLADRVSQSITGENLDETSSQDNLILLRQKIKEGSVPEPIVEEVAHMLDSWGIGEKALAVRSSASVEDSSKASFAGIHESFLNIRGLDNVMLAVKECYASLWSSRAVAYRKKLGISDSELEPAVVVMEMVEAQAAGVGFTCDPQTGREDVLVINANYGLGESVVTGAVEPDQYYLDAMSWSVIPRIININNGRKEGQTLIKEDGGTEFVHTMDSSARQVLSDDEIKGLGLLLLRVFEALGDYEQHQDVEWVFDGQDFILVQARPVTAMPRITCDALKKQPDIWSNGNFREALPMVQSPSNRSLMKRFIEADFDAAFIEIGYQLPEGLQFSKFLNGRLYGNLSAIQWCLFDSMGALPRETKTFWGGHQPEIEIGEQKPFRGTAGLKRVWHLIKAGSKVNMATKNSSKTLAQFSTSIDMLTEKDFGALQDKDFIDLYDEMGRIVELFAREFWFLSGAATTPVTSLMKILNKYIGDRAPVILNALMVGGEVGITSADHGYRLVELAEIARRDNDALQYFADRFFDPLSWEDQLSEESLFKQAFREFLKEYGHRAVYELDIINPRWREDPSYLLNIIGSTLDTADLSKLKTEQKEKCEQAWKEIREKVPSRKHKSINKLVGKAQSGAAVREKTKSVLAEAMEAYRMIAKELGIRFYERGFIENQKDVYFCTWPELTSIINGAWDGTGLQDLISDRKATKEEMERISPPDIILGQVPKYTETVTKASGNILAGVPVAAGKASGSARLINNPEEGNRLQPMDVLVAPSTDPGWTPLFLKASALIMETGGFLSHGAIVAREYGVPAVVNIPGVMKVIEEGQKVQVDGDEGKIILN